MEKLAHLLRHWIEHGKEHRERFEEVAAEIYADMPEVAKKLREAAKKYEDAEVALKKALEILGG